MGGPSRHVGIACRGRPRQRPVSAIRVDQLFARAGTASSGANQHDEVEPVADTFQFHISSSAGVGL
jgi:hypothetical protein